MTYSKRELIDYVKENDVKFVKLTFCDMFGRRRNISVLSTQLEDAFERGVSIDSSSVTGVEGIDLKLIPVSAMLSDLPWRPHSGKVVSVFCKLANIDYTPYECDPMVLLERQVDKLAQMGLTADVATECEFYVFKDEDGVLEPFDNADYCSCAPYDKCENLRRDIILSLEDMGLKPISSHHERGPGQNEVDFESADPLSAARNFVMFKAAVKNVCALNGARASFLPKPMANHPGSGLHFLITLDGKNAKDVTGAFAEGVMRRLKEITCLANTLNNSYARLGKGHKIAYSSLRGEAVRIYGEDNNIILLRTPDSACNVFAVLSLVFAAGREGIEKGYKLREEMSYDDCLFDDLTQAIEFAANSEWLHENIPGKLDEVLETLRHEAAVSSEIETDLDLFNRYADI